MANFYLGGDVSKGYCDFIMVNQKKAIAIKNMHLDDTARDHHRLESRLLDFVSENPDCRIIVGLESTGGYENNWFETLCSLQEKIDISVARINPIGTYHSGRAALQRVVTDKNSARTVAEYLINYQDKLNFRRPDKYSPLRRQWKHIRLLNKQRTQNYNQLERNLYNANPELLKYTNYGYPKWLLKVILKYPTAKDLANAKVSTLADIPYVSEERAKALIYKAKTSVASAIDKATGDLIITLVKEIIHLTRLINRQSKIISENCGLAEVDLLKSFKGIADYSAIGLLIHLGSVENFSNTKKLASFCGIHPTWKESGDGKSVMHISKKGNREVRALLYNIAFTAIRCNPLIKEIYLHHRSKGMKKKQALVACMHKILRIVFGMLKYNERFNPEKDRANSKKMANQQEKKSGVGKLIPFPSFDSDAPVSYRQHRKRKQQEMSQNEITSLNTGSVSHCSEESLLSKM